MFCLFLFQNLYHAWLQSNLYRSERYIFNLTKWKVIFKGESIFNQLLSSLLNLLIVSSFLKTDVTVWSQFQCDSSRILPRTHSRSHHHLHLSIKQTFGSLHTLIVFTLTWFSCFSALCARSFSESVIWLHRAALLRWPQRWTVATRWTGWLNTPVTETTWRATTANWPANSMTCPSTWHPSPWAVSIFSSEAGISEVQPMSQDPQTFYCYSFPTN